jgi:hypothetical protein
MASSYGYERDQIYRVIEPLGKIDVTLVEWQGISSYKLCDLRHPGGLVCQAVSILDTPNYEERIGRYQNEHVPHIATLLDRRHSPTDTKGTVI